MMTHAGDARASESDKGGEMETLPQPPQSALQSTPGTQAVQPVKIASAVPFYIDRNVTMVPMRPLAEFLGIAVSYHDGIVTLTRVLNVVPLKTRVITLRTGSKTAQITEGTERKAVVLAMPAEERLGTTFLPLRFVAENLGAEVRHEGGNLVRVRMGERVGILSAKAQEAYRGRDAARITIINRVGRALSLRLRGPQAVAVELGYNQSVTTSVRPGLYYYYAACTGMKTRSGARRLLAGRKAVWAWGRR